MESTQPQITLEQLVGPLEKLFAMVKNPVHRERMTVANKAHFELLCAGVDSAPSLAYVAVPAMIALLHVGMGAPLHYSDTLIDAWAAQGTAEVAECSRCGYRMPKAYRTCVVCGGRTGEPGIFSKMRAAAAGWN